MESKSYTVNEATKILGVSRTKVTYWINVGIIDGVKEKGKWLISGKSMKDWQDFQEAGVPVALEKMQTKFEYTSAEVLTALEKQDKGTVKA